MIENGFVYAVSKSLEKERKKQEKLKPSKENAMIIISEIQEKYDFCFGYMVKSDSEKMSKTDRKRYLKCLKLTTTYSDEVYKRLGLI